MIDNDSPQEATGRPAEDRMGFVVPKTPAHSLMLLTNYMRTDMLRHIHSRLHKMKDDDEPGSSLHHMAKVLGQVIDTWDSIDLFECFIRNQFHIDPDYEFHPEHDYLHDIRLMKHHLKCHRKTIRELDRWG